MKQRKFTTLTIKKNGTVYKKSVAYRTAAELAEKRAVFEQECDRKNNPTFSDVADKWQEEHFPMIEYYTMKSYIAPLKDLYAEIGDMRISDIEPLDVQTILDRMAAQGFKRQTINLRKVTASLIFDYAIFHGIVKFNPAKVCKTPKVPKSIRTPPSAEDISRILSAPDSFWKRYYLFLMYTGLRREEALALTRDDLDFENCTVKVDKVIIFNESTPVLRKRTKTDAGNRLAPFPVILHEHFKNSPKGLIFGHKGEYITRRQFENGIKKFQRDTGITCTSHQLRHYFATLCHGVIDAKDAQHLLGHAHIQTTLDVYTQIDDQQRRAAIDKLNSHINHN